MRGKDRKKEMCSQGASTGYSIEMQNLGSLYNCKIQRREKRKGKGKERKANWAAKGFIYLYCLQPSILR